MKKSLKNIIKLIFNILSWIKLYVNPRQFLIIASVIVGLFAGFGVVILKLFAHAVFLLANYLDSILKLPYSNSIFPIIGIFLTVFVIQRFLDGRIEKGLSQIMHTVARKRSLMPQKQMYSQILTNSLTVGFGGSAGMESPVAITGAAFGSNFAQYFKLSYKQRTLLVACGVAAATAAAFNAPIAGVLFAIEVILADVSVTAFIPIMISAATGAIISGLLLNDNILLHFYDKQIFELNDIGFYVLLGLITGWFSVYYSRSFQRITDYFNKLKVGPYRRATYGALSLALLIFIVPTLFGQGYESIKILSSSSPQELLKDTVFSDFKANPWILLLFVGMASFLKVFAVGFTLNGGGNGGNFAPSLFVGSYLGFALSYGINQLNLVKLPVASFVLVGMAGVFSGLLHAPLTAIFLIGEITSGYSLMIPLLIVSSISFAVSKRYEHFSMDIKKLAKKGEAFTSDKDRNVLSSIPIDKVLISDYQTLSPDDTLEKLVSIISNTDQRNFAVVDSQYKIVGILDFNTVRKLVFNPYNTKYSRIKEVMLPLKNFIFYENSIYIMLEKLELSKTDYLPIVKNGKYYGFISKMKILENYRNQHKSMIVE
ncbi:MAG: chloride channel protein [Bacteroidota bacterium]|nr:chloride channel protein [Bacteroidota bacterium]